MFLKLLLFGILIVFLAIHNVVAAPAPPAVDSSGASIIKFNSEASHKLAHIILS